MTARTFDAQGDVEKFKGLPSKPLLTTAKKTQVARPENEYRQFVGRNQGC